MIGFEEKLVNLNLTSKCEDCATNRTDFYFLNGLRILLVALGSGSGKLLAVSC